VLFRYHKKKYIWKLVYIFVLGYDVDFGHMEAISLMMSTKYSEKVVGYAAVALMVHPAGAPEDLVATVITAIKTDLDAMDDAGQCLALACIANMGGDKLAGPLVGSVQRLLVAQASHVCVKKKASLCLLRLFRTNPDCIVHRDWADRMSALLEQRHLGVLTSAMSLLLGFASRSPRDYESLVPYVIHNLHSLVVGGGGGAPDASKSISRGGAQAAPRCRQDYLYYQTPSPWLQVKLLKFLQYFEAPKDDLQMASLNAVLSKVINRTDASESVNKSNADHAVLFESVNLVIKHGRAGSSEKLRQQALTLLGRFITVREPNIRYIGLQTMARLAQVEGNGSIKKHETTVLSNLKDADISVRRRALDLLFVMCDHSNSANIVAELVTYLAVADRAIREELVLKIAIVAEKYAKDLEWYVTTILQLISLAGDQISDDIWHRLIQIVTNNKDLQAFAAEKLFVSLQSPRCHETLVKVGAYILGEFGCFIADTAGRSGEEQFTLLHEHFPNVTAFTQHQMLTTFVKMSNLYPDECRDKVAPIFERHKASGVLELQQRACEYINLTNQSDDVMIEDVLREMPAWTLEKVSALEKRLHEKHMDTADSNAWIKPGSDAGDDSAQARRGGAARGEEGQDGASTNAAVSLIDLDPTELPSAQPQSADLVQQPLLPLQQPQAAAVGGAVVGIGEDQIPSMKRWFNDLVCNQQGVLFENEWVQVTLRHAYQAHEARLAIYVKNKGPSATAYSELSVTVPKVSFLRTTMNQPISATINPGETAQLVLSADCMQPFEGAPECVVAFTDGSTGQKHKYPLRLPVVATKFMDPVTLNGEDFMTRWNQLASNDSSPQPREQQVVWKRSSNVAIDAATMTDIKTRILSIGLRLGLTIGLDTTDMQVGGYGHYITLQPPTCYNPVLANSEKLKYSSCCVTPQITAASTFRTGAVSNGQRVSIGTLLKLEANGTAFRLTVRAVHGKISVALKNIIKAQLA
jgi:AP-2 complex subunit alpha